MAQAREYIGQTIGNRLVLGHRYSEPKKDGKRRSLFAWRCLACGAESESVLVVLTKADKDGRRVCSSCSTGTLMPMPIGSVFQNLQVTGEQFRGKRYPNGGGHNWLVPCRCMDCGREGDWDKSSLKDGRASCRCKLNTLDGRSRTPEGRLFTAARVRARDQGVPFDITVDDIVIPEKCPVLGLPLESGHGGWADTSPTVDKIIPELGYVPGNIAVISWRANRLKHDGTLEELRAIVEWMDKQKGASRS
jgi:hypothetical protein